MLAALPENVVISEAGPLDRLARAESIPEAARAEWLHWMVSALGQTRSGRETRYFIKFDSPTVLALPSIRRAFPSAPWIFLYRNPEEVLISHLRQPAPAMCPGMITDFPAIDAPMCEAVSMSPEEYAARVIGRICECAALGMDEYGMLVNYTQLPDAVWGNIARRFGVGFSPDEIARMQAIADLRSAAIESDITERPLTQPRVDPIAEDSLIGPTKLTSAGQDSAAIDPNRKVKTCAVLESEAFRSELRAPVKRHRRNG